MLIAAMAAMFATSGFCAYAGSMESSSMIYISAAAEKTCDVTITEIGPNKVKVVKALRSVLNIELKDAYELTQKTPSTVAKGISAEKAAQLKSELEAAGATVSVKEN